MLLKNATITARRQKTELLTLLTCFIIANLANLYAVIAYNTSFIELITSLGYVAVATAVLYAAWTLLRLIVFGAVCLFRRKSN